MHGSNPSSPPWTLAGFNLGMRLALPIMPGMIAFGLAVGATAARKGFSFVDSLLMNVVVYAGMSQLVAMEAWPERVTIGAMFALAVLCATVNARMLLMSAALYPTLKAMLAAGRISRAAAANAIASCAEGYSFPTNLDRDPPIGGLAPETQRALFHRALAESWSPGAFSRALDEQASKKLT